GLRRIRQTGSLRTDAVRVLHCLQENVFKRVTLEIKAANLDLMLVSDSIEIANLNAVLEYQLEPPLACERVFTTQLRDCLSESVTFAARFKLQEFAIRFAFFFEVAIDGNAPALDDENLFTAFFDVSEQM